MYRGRAETSCQKGLVLAATPLESLYPLPNFLPPLLSLLPVHVAFQSDYVPLTGVFGKS